MRYTNPRTHSLTTRRTVAKRVVNASPVHLYVHKRLSCRIEFNNVGASISQSVVQVIKSLRDPLKAVDTKLVAT